MPNAASADDALDTGSNHRQQLPHDRPTICPLSRAASLSMVQKMGPMDVATKPFHHAHPPSPPRTGIRTSAHKFDLAADTLRKEVKMHLGLDTCPVSGRRLRSPHRSGPLERGDSHFIRRPCIRWQEGQTDWSTADATSSRRCWTTTPTTAVTLLQPPRPPRLWHGANVALLCP